MRPVACTTTSDFSPAVRSKLAECVALNLIHTRLSASGFSAFMSGLCCSRTPSVHISLVHDQVGDAAALLLARYLTQNESRAGFSMQLIHCVIDYENK